MTPPTGTGSHIMPDYLSSDTVAERFQAMHFSGRHRRFLVNRMGNTGSTWLAKLLNAHPDVFCEHEGIVTRIWPRSEYDEQDIIDYLTFIAAYERHEAYKAVGDVGSMWLNHVVEAPRDEFMTAILVRHPVRILNTRLRQVRAGHTEYTDYATDEVSRFFGLDLASVAEADRYFVNDCAVFLGVAELFERVGMLIRIEGFSDRTYAVSTLEQLTGLCYSPELIQTLWFQRINAHNNTNDPAAIFAGFSEWQKDFYLQHLDPVAQSIGYTLRDDTPPIAFTCDRDLGVPELKPVNTGAVDRTSTRTRIVTSDVRGDYAAYMEFEPGFIESPSTTFRIDVAVVRGTLDIVVQGEEWGDALASYTVRARDQRQAVDLIVADASRIRRLIFRNDTNDGTPTTAHVNSVQLGRLSLPDWPEYQPK